MLHRRPMIIFAFGALERDLPECPGEGWFEWLCDLPGVQSASGQRRGFRDDAENTFWQITKSHTADPGWVGVIMICTEQSLTFYDDIGTENLEPARSTWGRFRDLAASKGVSLPEGRVLVSLDYLPEPLIRHDLFGRPRPNYPALGRALFPVEPMPAPTTPIYDKGEAENSAK